MLIAFSLLLATTAAPDDADAAHRADRARTQALNRAAIGNITRHDRDEDAAQAAYRAAHARYARAMTEWRARTAACDRGDVEACR